ncbi:Hypothetical protein, predicted transmembrane protein [Mycoplasma mycoides subsp. capri PG3]|nr:Hypothetical protein, predicted transmembrane protein [Mycoplasma mycoides subsp. capri PG3]
MYKVYIILIFYIYLVYIKYKKRTPKRSSIFSSIIFGFTNRPPWPDELTATQRINIKYLYFKYIIIILVLQLISK